MCMCVFVYQKSQYSISEVAIFRRVCLQGWPLAGIWELCFCHALYVNQAVFPLGGLCSAVPVCLD